MKSLKPLPRIEKKRKEGEKEMKTEMDLWEKYREGTACPLCGNYEGYDEEYYSQLEWILKDRLFACLLSNNSNCYKDGVLECIHAVFGPRNPEIRQMLEECGFLSRFDQLIDQDKIGFTQFGRFGQRFV